MLVCLCNSGPGGHFRCWSGIVKSYNNSLPWPILNVGSRPEVAKPKTECLHQQGHQALGILWLTTAQTEYKGSQLPNLNKKTIQSPSKTTLKAGFHRQTRQIPMQIRNLACEIRWRGRAQTVTTNVSIWLTKEAHLSADQTVNDSTCKTA